MSIKKKVASGRKKEQCTFDGQEHSQYNIKHAHKTIENTVIPTLKTLVSVTVKQANIAQSMRRLINCQKDFLKMFRQAGAKE